MLPSLDLYHLDKTTEVQLRHLQEQVVQIRQQLAERYSQPLSYYSSKNPCFPCSGTDCYATGDGISIRSSRQMRTAPLLASAGVIRRWHKSSHPIKRHATPRNAIDFKTVASITSLTDVFLSHYPHRYSSFNRTFLTTPIYLELYYGDHVLSANLRNAERPALGLLKSSH